MIWEFSLKIFSFEVKLIFFKDEIFELFLLFISLFEFMNKFPFEWNFEDFWVKSFKSRFTSLSIMKFEFLLFIEFNLSFILKIFRFEFSLKISSDIFKFNSFESILEFSLKIVSLTIIWLRLLFLSLFLFVVFSLVSEFVFLLLSFLSSWLFKLSFPMTEFLFIKLFDLIFSFESVWMIEFLLFMLFEFMFRDCDFNKALLLSFPIFFMFLAFMFILLFDIISPLLIKFPFVSIFTELFAIILPWLFTPRPSLVPISFILFAYIPPRFDESIKNLISSSFDLLFVFVSLSLPFSFVIFLSSEMEFLPVIIFISFAWMFAFIFVE